MIAVARGWKIGSSGWVLSLKPCPGSRVTCGAFADGASSAPSPIVHYGTH